MGDPFTWGMAPKSQSDSQTIDDAIAAAVSAHNDDPDAHLGVGQSLQSHRASEIIDHEAGSIVADKLNSAVNFIFMPVNVEFDNPPDGVTNSYPGVVYEYTQISPITGDADNEWLEFACADEGYVDKDVVEDLIFYAYGSSGTFQAQFDNTHFGIQIKDSFVRLMYYTSSWQYSSWIAVDPSQRAKWRMHYDSRNNILNWYRNGALIFSVGYTIDISFYNSFLLHFLSNRGTSSNLTVGFGNIGLALEPTI